MTGSLATVSSVAIYSFSTTKNTNVEIVVRAARKSPPSELDSRMTLWSAATKTAVLTNDNATNVDNGETLTVTPVVNGTTANGGTYSIDANGDYTYTPAQDFNGVDSFTYTVSDAATSATILQETSWPSSSSPSAPPPSS